MTSAIPAAVILLPSLVFADLSVTTPRSTAIRVACEELVVKGFDSYDRIAQRLGGGLWLQMGITGGNVYFVSDPLFDTMDALAWFHPGVTLNLPQTMRKRPTLDEVLRASDAQASSSNGALTVRTSSGGSCSMGVRRDRRSRLLSIDLAPNP